MTYVLQIVLDGLVIGSQYVLVAVGFTLIFGVMGVMNVAQGDFFMLGAFVLLELTVGTALSPMVGITVAMLSGLLIGFLYYYLVLKRIGEGAFLAAFVASVGVSYFIENALSSLVGSAPRGVPAIIPGDYLNVAGLAVSISQLVLLTVTLGVSGAILMLLSRTSLGRDIRAVAESRVLAAAVGVDPDRTSLIATLIASFVATIGGVLVSQTTLTVSPFTGAEVTLPMFAVAIVAGTGSVGGAVIAGFLLGVAQSLTVAYIGSSWEALVGLGVLVLVLLRRPEGIFGRVARVG